jgi:hypothetical protein
MAKMFHDDVCAELMGGLPGMGADFQYLAEGAKCVSSCLGGVIRTRIGDDDNP